MQLGREWRETVARIDALPDDDEITFNTLTNRRHVLEAQILMIQATGFAGLAAKANILDFYGPEEQIGAAESLIADVRRLAAQAV